MSVIKQAHCNACHLSIDSSVFHTALSKFRVMWFRNWTWLNMCKGKMTKLSPTPLSYDRVFFGRCVSRDIIRMWRTCREAPGSHPDLGEILAVRRECEPRRHSPAHCFIKELLFWSRFHKIQNNKALCEHRKKTFERSLVHEMQQILESNGSFLYFY